MYGINIEKKITKGYFTRHTLLTEGSQRLRTFCVLLQ